MLFKTKETNEFKNEVLTKLENNIKRTEQYIEEIKEAIAEGNDKLSDLLKQQEGKLYGLKMALLSVEAVSTETNALFE